MYHKAYLYPCRYKFIIMYLCINKYLYHNVSQNVYLNIFYLNHFMYYIDFFDYCILYRGIMFLQPVEVEQNKYHNLVDIIGLS